MNKEKKKTSLFISTMITVLYSVIFGVLAGIGTYFISNILSGSLYKALFVSFTFVACFQWFIIGCLCNGVAIGKEGKNKK